MAAFLGLKQFAALAVLTGSSVVWGQGMLVEPPTPLFPLNPVLSLPGLGSPVPAQSGDEQAILKEDGLKRLDSRVVAGTKPGWITAYEFGDATGAVSAYSFYRQGGHPVAKGVNATEFETSAGERVFLAGTSVVRASVHDDTLLKKVEIGLPKIGGRRGQAPLLPTLFPAAGLQTATMRYALGPVSYTAMGGTLPAADLGWDKDAEVAFASYDNGKGLVTLLLYPTPQIAGDRGRAVEKDINGAAEGKFGMVKMRRLGPLVGVATGSFEEARALGLVNALKLNQEITFDKPMPLEFHAEIQKTYTLLQSIAAFVGVGLIAAVVLGIFLGGARAGIRVLRGKSAASDPEFLTINLRDKPKGVLLGETDKKS